MPSEVFVRLKKGKSHCEIQVLQEVQKKTFLQAAETAGSQESLLFPMLKLKMSNTEVKKDQNRVTEV